MTKFCWSEIDTTHIMDKYSFLNAAHTAYFADLYEQYLKNPDSVEPSWRAFFQGYDFGSESYGMSDEIIEGVSTQIPEHVQKEFQVVKLIDGYWNRIVLCLSKNLPLDLFWDTTVIAQMLRATIHQREAFDPL